MAGSRFFRKLRRVDEYVRRLEADNLRLREALDIEMMVRADMMQGLERVTLEVAEVYEDWKKSDSDPSAFLKTADEMADDLLQILQHSHPDYVLEPERD